MADRPRGCGCVAIVLTLPIPGPWKVISYAWAEGRDGLIRPGAATASTTSPRDSSATLVSLRQRCSCRKLRDKVRLPIVRMSYPVCCSRTIKTSQMGIRLRCQFSPEDARCRYDVAVVNARWKRSLLTWLTVSDGVGIRGRRMVISNASSSDFNFSSLPNQSHLHRSTYD